MAKSPKFTEELEGNYTELSTGVKVRFRQMPPNMSQSVFTRLLREAKLDKNGNIQESADPQENLRLLDKMNSYYSTLIAFGATLVGSPEDYSDIVDKRWLKNLILAEYDLSKYNLEDPEDLEFLFMRHYGFASAEDWQVLSENVLNLPS